MWFDVQKALAEIERDDTPLSSPPLPAAQTPATRTRVAVVASVATGATHKRKTESPARDDMQPGETFRHGVSVTGLPLTWTGRIVLLDDWRRLTEWEKHGPNGRRWNGSTKQWEEPE